MSDLKGKMKYRGRQSAIKLFVILTVLFFTSLTIGSYFGVVFIHDTLREERKEQAQIRLIGFTKALDTVLQLTKNVGIGLTRSLKQRSDGDRGDDASIQTYLTSAPWTKAVILKTPEQTIVYPKEITMAALKLPLPNGPLEESSLVGPFAMTDDTNVLVYRFPINNGYLDLVLGFKDLFKAVGFVELEQSTQMTVHTKHSSLSTDKAIVGNAELDPDKAVSANINAANATWTISVVPRALDAGSQNWNRTLILVAGLLAVSFLAPFLGLICLLRARLQDNVDIHRSRLEIESISRHLDVALNASSIGLWEHDLTTNRQIWDEQIMKLYGITGECNIQTFESWLSRLHPDDKPLFRQFDWNDARKQGGFISEYRILTPDGQEKSVRSAGNAFTDADGRRKFVGVNWDVSADKALQLALAEAKAKAESQNIELEKAHGQMSQIALQDALTGIANRRHFEKKLESAQTNGTLPPETQIILIDLDRFKSINDTMGHFYGDDVLKYAAKVFSENLGPNDFLARTGGDEFVVLMPKGADADRFSNDILSAFSRPVRISGLSSRVGVSIGIATAQGYEETAGELLIKADLALYEAKKRGRGRTVHYASELMTQTFSLKRTADELQEAVESGQITAFFQPIFNAQTQKIVGVEALARWKHPERGILEPRYFLDVAEHIGLLHSIDETIFNKAVHLIQHCKTASINIPTVSVNISAQRLQDPMLIEQLAAYDLPPSTIQFELLESIPFDRGDQALLQTVRLIRELGFGIDLDDFGSGYASLVSLTQVRPDRIKIAGQLIAPIVQSKDSLLIVEKIAHIAETFDIGVICEGVTTGAHSDELIKAGCYVQQGYHFSRPMDEDNFLTFLNDQP